MKYKTRHELACLDACDYADFAATRDNHVKNVWFSGIDGGTFRVLPYGNDPSTYEWTLIYCSTGLSGLAGSV